ncbi:hypothetical protein [Stieleria sedimenti]|uniref:hypothetical protein n=1 Tax=Stieleria sedimenti TaxID=2976331 RepID=UPI002B21CA2C|nr:hypothetical protein [Stieleria sedimenti]
MRETFRRDLGLTLRPVLPAPAELDDRELGIDLAFDAPPSPFFSAWALVRRTVRDDVLRAELDFAAAPLPLEFRDEEDEEDEEVFDFRRSRR